MAHHCNGMENVCPKSASYRVEWLTNPGGLPGMGKVVRRKACGIHLASTVQNGMNSKGIIAQHVHVLPVSSRHEWRVD